MKTSYLTLFLLICFSALGQTDSFQKVIVEYLNQNGTRQQYEQAYDAVYPLLEKNFKDFDIPEKEWEKLKKDKDEQVNEVLRMLSFAYRKHFTQEEIAKMNAFYKTEAAQKMLQNENLSEAESQEINSFFEGEIGQKLEAIRPELTQDIEKISTDWSKELFGKKMSTLIKDGYVY